MYIASLGELDRIRNGATPPPRRLREVLWEQAGRKCHYCKVDTHMGADGLLWEMATIDHIIPRYKGGTNDRKNLVSACNECNQRRNKEDACGLPEGALLGTFQSNRTVKIQKQVTVTTGKTQADITLQQRDQALKRIAELQKQLNEVSTELASMTLWRLTMRKINKAVTFRVKFYRKEEAKCRLTKRV